MVNDDTFEYLTDYLYDRISPSVKPGYGEEDNSPKKNKEAELCDLFEHYTYMNGDGALLMSDSGVLYVYNGKYYEKVTTETFFNEVIKTVLSRMQVSKVYCKNSNKFIAKECCSGMENKRQGHFVPNRRYIVFGNGVFDVKKGVLLPFSKDTRTDIIVDIDYDKDAIDPLWNSKIMEIIPNRDMREAFQMFCGSLLVDREEYRIEYVCFLIGPGSNGKSVIASAIANVFGDEYFTNFDPEQLLNDNNRMFNLANLDGALANFTDDMKQGNISSSGFKSFASGEKFQARHPYGHKIFKVKAPPLLCCANALPSTTDDSWGYHRRILPIYSSMRIWGDKDKDPNLKAKLCSTHARQAIFNWIYEGYKMIIANGGNIVLGKEVIEAQNDARADSNSLRRWIRDMRFIKVKDRPFGDNTWKTLKDWHKMYTDYCYDNGEKNPQISRSMSKIFREKGFEETRNKNGIWFSIGSEGIDDVPLGTDDGNDSESGIIRQVGMDDLPF